MNKTVADDKKSPKICILMPDFAGGGAERIMVYLANQFVRSGIQVEILAGLAAGPYLSQLDERVLLRSLGSKREIFVIHKVVLYLLRERCDAMLCILNTFNVVGILARQISRSKTHVVLSQRGTLTDFLRPDATWKQRLRLKLMRYTYKRAARVICISKGLANEISQQFSIDPDKLEVIYNPCDVTTVTSLSHESVDHPWFDPGEPPVILGVGRLVRQKDFPTLIEAFALVRRSRQCRLIILGVGPEKPKLEMLIEKLNVSNDVELLGFVQNPFAFMRNSSVFVLSSQYEAFGNVVVEALACGVPIVSTDCPFGPAEILEDGRWGKLVGIGDSTAMAEAILKTLNGDVVRSSEDRAQAFSGEKSVAEYKRVLLAPGNRES